MTGIQERVFECRDYVCTWRQECNLYNIHFNNRPSSKTSGWEADLSASTLCLRQREREESFSRELENAGWSQFSRSSTRAGSSPHNSLPCFLMMMNMMLVMCWVLIVMAVLVPRSFCGTAENPSAHGAADALVEAPLPEPADADLLFLDEPPEGSTCLWGRS